MPKAKQKRVNPRKIPMTEADVRKAWHDGADFGMTFCIKTFVYIPKDKHDATNEDLLQLKDEFEDVLDSYNRRDITDKDIDSVLDTDFDIHVLVR